MTIFTHSRALAWGELDVPLMALPRDLNGDLLGGSAAFSLVADLRFLWFVASHRRPAILHPKARPGCFLAGLWNYDVAELFLSDPQSGRYFEFNLAPNGAWWCCEMTAPRVREDEADIAMPGVVTYSEVAADGAWVAAMKIPLDLLVARLDFGPLTRGNVTMILESPAQRWLSLAELAAGEPDFHQPARFPQVNYVPIPTS